MSNDTQDTKNPLLKLTHLHLKKMRVNAHDQLVLSQAKAIMSKIAKHIDYNPGAQFCEILSLENGSLYAENAAILKGNGFDVYKFDFGKNVNGITNTVYVVKLCDQGISSYCRYYGNAKYDCVQL